MNSRDVHEELLYREIRNTHRKKKETEKKRQKRKKVSGRIAAKGRNTWDVCAY